MRHLTKENYELLYSICQQLIQIEVEYSNRPLLYIFNEEYDSNLTLFESLSNQYRIGIQTKLPSMYHKIAILILKSVVDCNIFRFDPTEYPVQDNKWLEFYLNDDENIVVKCNATSCISLHCLANYISVKCQE